MRGSFYTKNQLDWGSRREVTRDIPINMLCKGTTLTSIMYNNNSDKVMTYGDTLLEIVKSTLLVLFTFTTIRVAREYTVLVLKSTTWRIMYIASSYDVIDGRR